MSTSPFNTVTAKTSLDDDLERAAYSPTRSKRPRLIVLPRYFLLAFALVASYFMFFSNARVPLLRPKDGIWNRRADEVREAFLHAYNDYERFAFPRDEILPVTNGSKDNFNGWGVSALDSLDTMVIMQLDEEFDRAITHLKAIDIPAYAQSVPFFETVIRYLGGFLSAWHLTGDPLLLHRADQLGQALLPAFDTPSGFPSYGVVPKTGQQRGSWLGGNMYGFAESASCQMEYKYLAYLTGRAEYYHAAEGVMDGLLGLQDATTGLWAQILTGTGKELKPSALHYSVGAAGDSAYEYLLKQYLLSGRSEIQMLDMYLSSIRGVITNLLYVSHDRGLLYATDVTYRPTAGKQDEELQAIPSHNLEHLACFLPGLLALGAHTLRDHELPAAERKMHLDLAKGLGTTCYLAYAETKTGLGPETVNFGTEGRKWVDVYKEWVRNGSVGLAPGMQVNVDVEKDKARQEYVLKDARWLSRPETLESIFILSRVTGDPIWRERGYEIFQAIETWSRAPVAYTSMDRLDQDKPIRMNEMPSYFLAETLKYLYLLFKEDDAGISLDRIVFNTEAHPFPVFRWNGMERSLYGLDDQPRRLSKSLMDMIAM